MMNTRLSAYFAFIFILLMAYGSAAKAQGAPFACNADYYQVRSDVTASLIRFPAANLTAGGAVPTLWTSAPPLNSMGYRRSDNFLYGLSMTAGLPTFYRLGTTGSVQLGSIVTTGAQTPVLTTAFVATAGAFDSLGRYYFAGQGGTPNSITPSAIYRVDDFVTDVDPGTAGVQLGVAAIYTLPAGTLNFGDFVFGADGALYAALNTTLYQITLPAASGAATVNTRTISNVGGIGSAFLNSSGGLAVFNNGTQELFNISFGVGASFTTVVPVVAAPVTLTNAAAASSTDGASCALLIPTVNKAFSANLISGATTNLVFTISNPALNTAQTFSFTDTLPAGLTTSGSTVTLGAGCSGGTAVLNATNRTITLTNVVIAAGGSTAATTCTITVPVTTSAAPTVGVCPASANNINANANISATTNINVAITPSATSGTAPTAGACVTVTAPQASLVITKTDNNATTTSGATNNYVVTLTNQGPSPANNAVLTDVVGTGLTCPGTNPVVCTVLVAGAVCPAAPLTVANLTGAGITIATLPANGSLQFAYSCNVN
jgi:uncharacterized repeat protein (TIGR01451 family)